MASKVNTYEGGSDTTTITTGNSGGASGDAFGVVSIGAGAAQTFSAEQESHGSLSAKFVTPTTVQNRHGWSNTPDSTGIAQAWFRVYCYVTVAPEANTVMLRWRNGATPNTAGGMLFNADRTVSIRRGTTVAATSTNLLPLNQWFRVEMRIVGDAAAGEVEARLFFGDPDATSPTETLGPVTGVATVGVVNGVEWGQGVGSSTGAAISAWYYDSATWSDTDWLGPVTVAPPPPLELRCVIESRPFGPF